MRTFASAVSFLAAIEYRSLVIIDWGGEVPPAFSLLSSAGPTIFSWEWSRFIPQFNHLEYHYCLLRLGWVLDVWCIGYVVYCYANHVLWRETCMVCVCDIDMTCNTYLVNIPFSCLTGANSVRVVTSLSGWNCYFLLNSTALLTTKHYAIRGTTTHHCTQQLIP